MAATVPSYLYKLLIVSVDAEGIARVAMNSPQNSNAFTLLILDELTDVFSRFNQDCRVKSVIISGEGKAFSGGLDLDYLLNMAKSTNFEEARSGIQKIIRMFETVHACSKPVVAQLHGVVAGGGVGLAAACDYVVAAEGTNFKVSEKKFGLRPTAIFPYLIARIGCDNTAIAASFPEETLLYSTDAHRCGLIDEVRTQQELAPSVTAVAQQAVLRGKEWLREESARKRGKEILQGEIDSPLQTTTSKISDLMKRNIETAPFIVNDMAGIICTPGFSDKVGRALKMIRMIRH